eukprot:scaffold9231_cov318-Chaetoceros_neogracile.AAC.1
MRDKLPAPSASTSVEGSAPSHSTAIEVVFDRQEKDGSENSVHLVVSDGGSGIAPAETSAPTPTKRKPRRTFAKVLLLIVTVSALIAFLVNHFWDTTDEPSDLPSDAPSVGLDKIFGEFETGDEGVELEWKSGGQGLELTIVNSLTNDWDQ